MEQFLYILSTLLVVVYGQAALMLSRAYFSCFTWKYLLWKVVGNDATKYRFVWLLPGKERALYSLSWKKFFMMEG